MKRIRGLGICLFLMMLLIVFLFCNRRAFSEHFGPAYISTIAVIVGTNAYYGESPKAAYEFTVNGRVYGGYGKVKPLENSFLTYVAPKVMVIFYNPVDPSLNYSADRGIDWWGLFVVFLLCPLILLFALWAFVGGFLLGIEVFEVW